MRNLNILKVIYYVMMSSDLFAVLVIVHAGQGTVRVAIHICVYTTGVAVTSPANITLKITEQI